MKIIFINAMCIDLLPEKHLQVIKKKEKWYERNTSVFKFYFNFQNVPIYMVFLFQEGEKNSLLKQYFETHFHKKPSNLNTYGTWIQYFSQ